MGDRLWVMCPITSYLKNMRGIRITPRVQAEVGFKFDSTLGFNDNIGFRFGTCYPWTLYDLEAEKELPIIEETVA